MTDISKDILTKHLPYEIDMLRQTYRKLRQGPLPEWAINNALIESFCIHARSLLDFFENRGNKPDDYNAADFTTTFVSGIDQSSETIKTIRLKLNKEVFHLMAERKNIETEQFNMRTDGTQLIRELEQEIQRFEASLPTDLRALFKCTIPPVTFLDMSSFKGPVNSTTAEGGSFGVT
jgi:hypothetical protein